MKKCNNTKCKQPNPQPLEYFYKRSDSKDGYRGECKACKKERDESSEMIKKRKQWSIRGNRKELRNAYRSKPEVKIKEQNYHLKNKYGISLEDKEKMFRNQNAKCAISKCNYIFTNLSDAHVDHNHQTGLIRELLCSNCNKAIGLLQENLDKIDSLSTYLLKHIDAK